MKELEIPKWINANNAYKLQQKKGQINGNHVNGDVTKSKRERLEERSTNLSIGLARLAYKCHVSIELFWIGVNTDSTGIQVIRKGTKANANDGSYPIPRTSEKIRIESDTKT